jgi:hypothetical protein
MVSRSTILWVSGIVVAGLAAACAQPMSTPGTDRQTRTTATMVTWSDGRPAISISCDMPEGCQSRALAMCSTGNYTVLDMNNMPTRGNATVVRGPASVVVRCS